MSFVFQVITLNQKMISNDASNLKYGDNFIFVFVTWIRALEEKKKVGSQKKVDVATTIARKATVVGQASSSNS